MTRSNRPNHRPRPPLSPAVALSDLRDDLLRRVPAYLVADPRGLSPLAVLATHNRVYWSIEDLRAHSALLRERAPRAPLIDAKPVVETAHAVMHWCSELLRAKRVADDIPLPPPAARGGLSPYPDTLYRTRRVYVPLTDADIWSSSEILSLLRMRLGEFRRAMHAIGMGAWLDQYLAGRDAPGTDTPRARPARPRRLPPLLLSAS